MLSGIIESDFTDGCLRKMFQPTFKLDEPVGWLLCHEPWMDAKRGDDMRWVVPGCGGSFFPVGNAGRIEHAPSALCRMHVFFAEEDMAVSVVKSRQQMVCELHEES